MGRDDAAAPQRGRIERVGATRERILVTAERLFAEHGVFAVSNRQIGEAAGQGNTAAVGYHFGARSGLVRAIVRRHAEPIERVRERMVAAIGDRPDLRDQVSCLVRPSTEHLAALGVPSWYARFSAQVLADASLREVVLDEALASPALRRLLTGLHRCRPDLPAEVVDERDGMTGQLIVHLCAERERALAAGTATPRATWRDAATGLIDAITGLWSAPASSAPGDRTNTTSDGGVG
ncbi:TetR/AcrR family transcriptional regulator [Saccharopolyspora sp. CA-218241]|uniref:TetR/AcrR family transcriptional regulator n=1 Tax=Saccharopolyspora sp. CA-218241 TaxID=3240027 RepID=UPI003D95EFE3